MFRIFFFFQLATCLQKRSKNFVRISVHFLCHVHTISFQFLHTKFYRKSTKKKSRPESYRQWIHFLWNIQSLYALFSMEIPQKLDEYFSKGNGIMGYGLFERICCCCFFLSTGYSHYCKATDTLPINNTKDSLLTCPKVHTKLLRICLRGLSRNNSVIARPQQTPLSLV